MYLKASILGVALLCSMSSIAWAAADDGGSGSSTPKARSLEDALRMLDTKADHDWTEGGLPRIERLEELTGGDVTRVEVDNITKGKKRDEWPGGAGSAAGGSASDGETDPANAGEPVAKRNEAGGDITDATGTATERQALDNTSDDAPNLRGGVPTPEVAPGEAAGGAGPAPTTKDEKVRADIQRAEAQRADAPGPIDTPVPGEVRPFVNPNVGDTILVGFKNDQLHQGVHAEAVGIIVKVIDGAKGLINAKILSPDGGADEFMTGIRHASKINETPVDSPDRNLPSWQYASDER